MNDYRLLNALLVLASLHVAVAVAGLAVRGRGSLPVACGLLLHAALLAVVAVSRFHGGGPPGVWLLTAGGVSAAFLIALTAMTDHKAHGSQPVDLTDETDDAVSPTASPCRRDSHE